MLIQRLGPNSFPQKAHGFTIERDLSNQLPGLDPPVLCEESVFWGASNFVSIGKPHCDHIGRRTASHSANRTDSGGTKNVITWTHIVNANEPSRSFDQRLCREALINYAEIKAPKLLGLLVDALHASDGDLSDLPVAEPGRVDTHWRVRPCLPDGSSVLLDQLLSVSQHQHAGFGEGFDRLLQEHRQRRRLPATRRHDQQRVSRRALEVAEQSIYGGTLVWTEGDHTKLPCFAFTRGPRWNIDGVNPRSSRFRAFSNVTGSISLVMQRRPSMAHASAVVPPPQKGSTTRSPGRV
jgi:hypothetical protein